MGVISEYTVTINGIPYTYNTLRGIFLPSLEGLKQLQMFSNQKNTIQYLGASFHDVLIEIGNVEYSEKGVYVQVTMFSGERLL